MRKIDIFTVITAPGRPYYFNKLLKSIESNLDFINQHIVIFNGFNKTIDVNLFNISNTIKAFYTDRLLSIGNVINKFHTVINSDLVIKLDDDSEIISNNFIPHILEINKLKPNSVFSPFPVGLINNLGGVQSNNREVIYGQATNTYYTLRKVNHIGGFARISPSFLYSKINFSDSHNEDGEFSQYCRVNGIEMFYLENALIVEHQESSLGQHYRYGKEYFGERF